MSDITNSVDRRPDVFQPPLPFMTRFWLFLFGWMFDQIKFFKKNYQFIDEYLDQGAIVHVFQYTSYLEYLIFNHFLRKRNIPPAMYPAQSWFGKAWARFSAWLKFKLREPARQPMPDFRSGEHYMLFLQQKGSFLSVRSKRQVEEIKRLIGLQKNSQTPIFLMPHVTIWTKSPVSLNRSLTDIFLGNSLQPGAIRKFLILIRNFRSAFIRTGQPINLSDWTSDEFQKHGKSPSKEIRWRLFKFFSEERMSVTGPHTRPRTWILESVLNSKEVQETIREVAEEEGKTPRQVSLEAAEELDFMAADYKYSFIVLASFFIDRVFFRLFNPIVFDKDSRECVRELLKKHPVVFVPSHKSHVDYLTWSWILHKNGMFPPHIIAGENLSFWPMGFLFRRMGAVFIRRSFKGNRLYNVLLRNYLAVLLWEGYSHEFFIEGGRSRTGKLLLPKFGILSMYVDAFLKSPNRDVVFLPVSIIYGKLIEQSSYGKELEGGEKKRESTKSLFGVFEALKFRYGALHIRVGDAIHIKEYLAERGLEASQVTGGERHKFVEEIGFDLICRINDVTTATPSAVVALALLTVSRKGVTQQRLMETVEIILGLLKDRNAHLSQDLENSLFAISEILDVFLNDGVLQSHTIGNEIVYTIQDSKRLSLDYYKNYILHYFVPPAILALAHASFGMRKVSEEDMRRRMSFLAELLTYELVFTPKRQLEPLFDGTIRYFEEKHLIESDGHGNLIIGENATRQLAFFRNILRNILESYWVVTLSLNSLVGKRMTEKKFLKIIMDEGKKLALIGEMERGEAYSKTNFKNAILYLDKRGVLVRNQDFEDTSITILPVDEKSSRKAVKAATKASKKKAVFLELVEDYNSQSMVKDLAEEIRFYLDLGRKDV